MSFLQWFLLGNQAVVAVVLQPLAVQLPAPAGELKQRSLGCRYVHPDGYRHAAHCLVQAEAVCDDAELERRWRAVLERHSGSPRLWRAYLQFR